MVRVSRSMVILGDKLWDIIEFWWKSIPWLLFKLYRFKGMSVWLNRPTYTFLLISSSAPWKTRTGDRWRGGHIVRGHRVVSSQCLDWQLLHPYWAKAETWEPLLIQPVDALGETCHLDSGSGIQNWLSSPVGSNKAASVGWEEMGSLRASSDIYFSETSLESTHLCSADGNQGIPWRGGEIRPSSHPSVLPFITPSTHPSVLLSRITSGRARLVCSLYWNVLGI